ncbi:NAD-dependent epimerase/dehydratase family protein [Stygiolobus caldivivus]|uniref:NAD-dependent dehydratase n=1 Tax=Stygiolobus caldivivus TaxID=2824673 RepID=A0A8D5U6G5_9CREN|nr:NAD-dependent epimerase/dehydratase family protein [Stygiolobus caldivivus]BCU70510.1 NAD-dependent dehydratase [Stygiolobus caldivivus]
MSYVVTGGAGYIGGHLVDHLVGEKNEVIVIDDFSNGNYINNQAKYLKIDLRDKSAFSLRIPKGSILYHLAANPDVRTSMIDPFEHFSRDVEVTFNVLELARRNDVSLFIFASSSTVYGETDKIPTPESAELKPISNYGIFKLVGEQLVEYYSRIYGIKGISVRLANVTGGRVSHGVIKDFIEKLRKNPNKLEILGNGKQRKSYIYITDTISAFRILEKKSEKTYDAFNIGNEDWITVNEIAQIIEEEMGLVPVHEYVDRGDGRGWEGDVRFMLLDVTKIKRLGWAPKYSSAQAVRYAARDIIYGYNLRA